MGLDAGDALLALEGFSTTADDPCRPLLKQHSVEHDFDCLSERKNAFAHDKSAIHPSSTRLSSRQAPKQ